MRAYHYLRADMTAGAGREPAWTVGETRTVEGRVVLCERGYHSSPSWYDALQYAPGNVACVVEVSEPEQWAEDKQVSRTRTLLAARDASRELRLYACDCAERALTRERETGREPDARSWQAVEVARRYAEGQATDAARAAAWDAARAAASTAARAAARDAADAAARAASAAAWAARAAAWAAASDAASDAEKAWQRERLAGYLDALFPEEVPHA